MDTNGISAFSGKWFENILLVGSSLEINSRTDEYSLALLYVMNHICRFCLNFLFGNMFVGMWLCTGVRGNEVGVIYSSLKHLKAKSTFLR